MRKITDLKFYIEMLEKETRKLIPGQNKTNNVKLQAHHIHIVRKFIFFPAFHIIASLTAKN